MAASFPTSVKAFVAKTDNVDDIMAADINEIHDEVAALETYLIGNLARYNTAVAQVFTSGATAIIDYGTLVHDPGSRVTTGAAWKYTAARAGFYLIQAQAVLASNTGWVDGEASWLSLYKNGVLYSYLDYADLGSASGIYRKSHGMDLVQLAVGDYIDIRLNQASGGNIALIAQAVYNYVDIVRVM